MRKLVYGIGINDADYVVQPTIDGKQVWCPYYRRWHNMLLRQTPKEWERNPTYTGCKVCEEWRSFMAFRKWMMTQDWQGKELDKDLLGDGKLYSPANCIFVTGQVNTFTIDSGAARGKWPLGVSKQGNRFRAHCRGATPRYRGTFDTPHEAHLAWFAAKWELGCDLMEAQSCPRTQRGLWNYILRLESTM